MDKLNLKAEVVDLCESHATKSDVHTYYLGESLLKMKFKDKYYLDVLSAANVTTDGEDQSACQVTQKTKAMFIDSGADVAITYFKDQMKRRQEKTDDRRKFLVSMYDETFRGQPDQPMSIEEFEKKFFSSAGLTERILQEAYAVSKLKRIFENKDYDQMD